MKKTLLLTFLLPIIFNSCKKKDEGCPTFWGYQPPHSLIFIIEQSGEKLPDSILNNIKLSYDENGTKKYITDFSRGQNEPALNGFDLGIMGTREIGLLSGDSTIKDYYLKFPNGDIDTLYVDYKHLTQCEADTSSCGCLYPLNLVKYNGQVVLPDSSIKVQTVYIFNKQ